MGGAATAAPLEVLGGLAFNPATLTSMPNQISIGTESISTRVDLNSTLGTSTGNARSETGWNVVPAVGLAWKPDECSRTTIGFGVLGIASYTLDLPASTTSPILFPPTPNGSTTTPGFGNVFSDLSILQFTPTIAFEVNDSWSLAVGPTITSARMITSPFSFAAPDDANGDGVSTYPTGAGSSSAWGGGFQVGVYYQGDNYVNFGASYRSPQWMDGFDYNGTNELGNPRAMNFDFDYPMQVSFGTSYTGIEYITLACDVRYQDWKNAGTLGTPAGFAADGSVTGLGWDSTWSVGVGIQYEATDNMALRAGYMWAQSPINSANAGYNVGSPWTQQHAINFGGTYQLTKSLLAHATYYYAPKSSASGPMQSAAGPLAGSNVSYDASAHALSLGLTAMF